MPDLTSTLAELHDALNDAQERCIACGTCTKRCDLLESCGWNMRAVCAESRAVLEGASSVDDLRRGIDAHERLYRFVRSCEACNRCTVRCPQDLRMGNLWRPWRAIVRECGYIDDSEVALIGVDTPWHTFSVFRHLQGVDYDDVPLLRVEPIADAAEPGAGCSEEPVGVRSEAAGRPGNVLGSGLAQAETLFFPGCTLCSYAPGLTRAALSWLNEHIGPTLLATQCCAWPLECVGEVERARIWRERVVKAARDQGVRRIVSVCPGCDLQLQAAADTVAPAMEFVPLARLMADAGIRVSSADIGNCSLPVTVVDSCNDRAGVHGPAVRTLFEQVDTVPFPCTGEDAWCCGAGGNVSSYDERISRERTCRSYRLCHQVGAGTLVTACPTCAYTYSFERWLQAREGTVQYSDLGSLNYLEVVFGQRIDWSAVFAGLVNMWQGEHAAWVAARLS